MCEYHERGDTWFVLLRSGYMDPPCCAAMQDDEEGINEEDGAVTVEIERMSCDHLIETVICEVNFHR